MPKPKKKQRKEAVSAKSARELPRDTPAAVQKPTSPPPSIKTNLPWRLALICGLLIFMAAQMVRMAWVKSATMDEPNHITRGVSYLRTGDLRLARAHPPLVDLLIGVPLALDRRVVLPTDHPMWEARELDLFADQFLWKANQNIRSMIFRARLPVVALALLTALLLFFWSKELYGEKAGLVALALCAFDPNVLAHGSLATNDVGVSCFTTLSLYTFWRWLQKPGWGRAACAGIAFGLAQASKFSAIFLVPALIVVALVHWWTSSDREQRASKLLRALGAIAAMCVAGAIILLMIYGFKSGVLHNSSTVVPGALYVNELRLALARIGNGTSTFLLGSYSPSGWWYYFPVAFLVKTPIPTLLLVGAATVMAVARGTWRRDLILIIPALLYFGFSIVSRLNIGYRHLLPAVVVLLVFASQVVEERFRTKWPVWAGGALAAWLVIGTNLSAPDCLAYFNEAVGGSSNGYKVLVDSNLDWGQDLIGLRSYMDASRLDTI